MSEASTLPLWRRLYDEAFERYGNRVLWSQRKLASPEPGHARVVARSLRTGGDMAALRLAEKIESALSAAD
ncbi:MAG: hypothetical protein IT548_02105 [Alphaproteobacteria bacterium]|nr:hypothetical protein [Alphaproteobacteria bacterium]